MKATQPVRITYTDGRIARHTVGIYNLPSLLATIDMDKVAGIEYGEAIINDTKAPVEIRPSGFDYSYNKAEGLYHLNVFDKNDQKVATAKYQPHKLQQFAVDLLQQTTYRFNDVQDDHDHYKQRLEGLDK